MHVSTAAGTNHSTDKKAHAVGDRKAEKSAQSVQERRQSETTVAKTLAHSVKHHTHDVHVTPPTGVEELAAE
jgi:hypothetical protein